MTSAPILELSTNTHLNDGCEYRERVGPDAHAQTLLAYLSQRYRHSTVGQWADLAAPTVDRA